MDNSATDAPVSISASNSLITLTISGSNFPPQQFSIESNAFVRDLKLLISPKLPIQISRIRLLHGRTILKDDNLISDYGIQNGDKIMLAILANNETSAPTSSLKAPPPEQPEMALFNQISKNPFLKKIMNDPDTIQNILGSNPQFKELMKKNPEYKSVFHDSNFMDQFFNAAQNPELMKEMLRNNDRAMSNLEMQPGGFNYLTQMYNNIQKPMENNDISPNSTLAKLRNQNLARLLNITEPNKNEINTTPLPNPWSIKPSAPPSLSSFKSPLQMNPNINNNLIQQNPLFGDFSPNKNIHDIFNQSHQSPLIFANPQSKDKIGTQLSKMKISNSENTNNTLGSHSNNSLSSHNSNTSKNSFNQPQIINQQNEPKYESEATLLVEMGFDNIDMNRRALEIHDGDLSLAIEWLARHT
ncbi:Ubiquilin-1 [Smittium culicis]|uniref:Ubiquilin-1 n=1 Tax=Smittium culicis TaxID=133412 RepID=A0A1R1XP73_9FUNG|nr:Ubiquilin-1 [Smittium culicis]OMJ17641.1 Ubiquilin-1 [Smittium culicis]